ncbi:hypothetical protein Q5P01_003985 [Channa striata]|uniref:Lipocalin/cytosolic fatty-acid binding domain-containing protein n=1 Tax=Channa striata TaxID=64152 RepID=A0AA88T375_CHASR|nr:hypothetical protein Q5P01_003985 [Channa striata]
MSKTALKTLGALMFVLAVWAEVTPVKDFNLEKMTGKWFVVGFATNAQWFVDHKAEMKMGTAVLVATADGDLDLSNANLKDDGTCWKVNHLANKTETPGRFIYYSHVWKNDNELIVADVVYDDYATVTTNKTSDEGFYIVNELYSRTQEASAALQQNFTQFSVDNGILPENIVFPPKNNECPEA